MISEKTREIESDVLQTYTQVNPSKIPLENKLHRKRHLAKRERLFRDLLKIPLKTFNHSSLIDFGCGTGEQDICYALWGADVFLTDLNSYSLEMAEKYFQEFNLTHKLLGVRNTSVFDFQLRKKFDFVICEGMLHHTQEPGKGFNIIAQHLKRGGFIILQVAFDTSHFQRSLHRLVLDYLAEGETKEIERISRLLFQETLQRAHRFGGRSIKQIIYDFYVNPKHKGISLIEIMDWFKDNGIKYYSSYPQIEVEGIINGIHKPSFSSILMRNPEVLSLINFMFLAACRDDEDCVARIKSEGNACEKALDNLFKVSKLRDYEYGDKVDLNLLRSSFLDYSSSVERFLARKTRIHETDIKSFSREFVKLIDVLKSRDIKKISQVIKSFEILFKGYNGVPSNYITGYKK